VKWPVRFECAAEGTGSTATAARDAARELATAQL